MNSSTSTLQTFKIVFLGDCAVGKTCIVLRFAKDSFQENYVLTIGLNYEVKKMTLSNNETIKVQIWDTSGEEKYKSLSKNYYREADGILVVYDITKDNTFQGVKKWMEQIKENIDTNKIVLSLVGNKSDLEPLRVIKKEDGENLAKEYGISFFETSAKENSNIDNIFQFMAEEMYKKRQNIKGGTKDKKGVSLDKKEKKTLKQRCCKK